MVDSVTSSTSTGQTAAASGSADARFDGFLQRIEEAGLKRAERDAESTESKEAVGALKNAARATSA